MTDARCAHAASLPPERAASPAAASNGKGGSISQAKKKNQTAGLFDIEESEDGK